MSKRIDDPWRSMFCKTCKNRQYTYTEKCLGSGRDSDHAIPCSNIVYCESYEYKKGALEDMNECKTGETLGVLRRLVRAENKLLELGFVYCPPEWKKLRHNSEESALLKAFMADNTVYRRECFVCKGYANKNRCGSCTSANAWEFNVEKFSD